MQAFIKKTILLFFLSFSVLLLPSRLKLLTYGFKLEKLKISLPFSSEWETTLNDEDLKTIFSQKFSFLGKGAQSYVFESEDQKYVLKLFRFDPRKKSFCDGKDWSLWQVKQAISLFSSCKLGFEKAKEETALIYLHLNLTDKKLPSVLLYDALGRRYKISLDDYRFAIQRKVIPLKEAFILAKKEGVLRERADALRALLEKRTMKGIGNRDPSLWRNFGFLGDQAIELDFGNYVERADFIDPIKRQKEIDRYMIPLEKWLEKEGE